MNPSKLSMLVAALVAGSLFASVASTEAAVTYSSVITINNTGNASSGVINPSSISTGDRFNVSFVFDDSIQATGVNNSPGNTYLLFAAGSFSSLQITPVVGNSGNFVPAWSGTPYSSFGIFNSGGNVQLRFNLGFTDGSSVGYTGGEAGPGPADFAYLNFSFTTSQAYNASWGVGTPASAALASPENTWVSQNAFFGFDGLEGDFMNDSPTASGPATISSVPEPGMAALMLLGTISLLVRRRK